MPNSQRRPWWTPERVRELRQRREAGERREAIAAAMGTTFITIKNALCRFGIYVPGWTGGRGFQPTAGRESHTSHRLWCLGPVEPRHKFWSDDPRRTRVCKACRKALAAGVEDMGPVGSAGGQRRPQTMEDAA